MNVSVGVFRCSRSQILTGFKFDYELRGDFDLGIHLILRCLQELSITYLVVRLAFIVLRNFCSVCSGTAGESNWTVRWPDEKRDKR